MVTYYSDEILKNIYEIKRCYNTIQSKKEHFHKELSMALIEEGTTSTRFENKAYDFGYKNFIIIPPRLVHSCNPADINRWKFTMLYIDDDWFCNTFRTGIDGNMLFYCKLKEDEYAEIKTLLSYLGKNTDHIDKESLLIEIINRYYLQRNTAFSNIALEPFAKKEIKRVKLYIELTFRTLEPGAVNLFFTIQNILSDNLIH